MEKQPIPVEEKQPQFLTKKQQEKRKKMLEDLLLCVPSELRFFVFWQSKNIMSVGIKGRRFGMWLFDANSRSEVEALRANGVEIEDNPNDLILEGELAEISEVEKKMPGFIARFYPQIALLIPKQNIKIEKQNLNSK